MARNATNRRVARSVRTLIAVALIACSASCEYLAHQRAFWRSPEGQRLQAMQWMQLGNQMQQQNLVYQQQRFQAEQLQMQRTHDYLMRSTPVRVEHSGSVDVRHSGTIRIRR
jgi:hypothetical protein